MKYVLVIFVLIISILIAGCTASSPQSGSPAVSTTSSVLAYPNLTGSWTGPMEGYDKGTGFSDYKNLSVVMTITEQQGRIFAGNMTIKGDGLDVVSGIAGVIAVDNRTFSIAEEYGGYCFGDVLSPDAIDMTYLDDGSPYSAAVNRFTRIS